MRMRSRARFGSERGAVFVQVGIAMFVLVAFNVFVLDYGVMWVARSQAQAAADAGALAGAVARGYDDFDPTPSPTEAARLAKAAASANLVWNQPATADVPSFDCPAGAPPGRCVRVDVYRDGTNASTTLPTIFGPLLGVNSQGVKAMAIGLSGNGNATNCLRPLAFADRWNAPTSTTSSTPPPDTYTPPGSTISTRVRADQFAFRPDSDALADPSPTPCSFRSTFTAAGHRSTTRPTSRGVTVNARDRRDQIPLMAGQPAYMVECNNKRRRNQRLDRSGS